MAVLRVHRGASGPGPGPSGPWPSPAGRWPPSRLPPPGTQNGHSELIGAPQTRCDPSLESELKSASIVAGISRKAENRFSKICGMLKSALFEHPKVRTYLWVVENRGHLVLVLCVFFRPKKISRAVRYQKKIFLPDGCKTQF